MNGGKVLVAGVDTQLVQEISTQLKSLGLEPVWTPTNEDVVRSFVRHVPEAVILWDAAPGFDGWETARLIRAISDTPIIFLSDSADRLTRKRALQVGDEVLSPPWQWERLPARLGALLRRAANTGLALPDLYDDGYLLVDISGHAVTRNGKPVELSTTEFKLLSCFVRYPNRALSYAQILQNVWGHSYLKAKSDVSQYVGYLRQKIEVDPARPDYFRSIRGIGYLFMVRL